MENNKQIGLVLKRFLPFKQKISILNRISGKHNLITTPSNLSQKLWPGMIIEYQLIRNSSVNIIANHINIIATLTNITKQNIKWLHSILEISYYSLPLAAPAPEIFEILYYSIRLLSKQNIFDEKFKIIKKIYFLKLIHLLGICSYENYEAYSKQLHLFSSVFIDISDELKVESVKVALEKIDKQTEKNIDLVINQSIKNHPFSKNFKTTYFNN